MLSLTWSKKNIFIGPEALHQDPRPKTQDPRRPKPKPKPEPKPTPTPSRAEPSRPDGGGGARVGSLPLSPSCLTHDIK